MKFQWPKDAGEVKTISIKQVEWFLQGLEVEQKKAHHNIEMKGKEREPVFKLSSKSPWSLELPDDCRLTIRKKS